MEYQTLMNGQEPTIPLYRTWWGLWLTESDVGLILLILATMTLVIHLIGIYCEGKSE